jgi:hypothetical protein
MEKLSPPSPSALKVFRACISNVDDNVLKVRLESIEGDIVAAARSYRERAKRSTLYRLLPQPNVRGVVSKKEMSDVYDRMVKKSGLGREFYDQIFEAPEYGRCPLCALQDVFTLDHYLSQSDFPVLSVVPINLVPACFACNKRKGTKRATSAVEQFMHPYFDNVDRAQWLKARVKEVSPGALEYFVQGSRSWSAEKRKRVEFHFNELKLDELYASHAAQEIVGNQRRFIELLDSGGPAAVRRHLAAQRDSWAAKHRNSWKTVMFATLASNDWFCRGGFR